MVELSIIIPIYNTPESDLIKCFGSIDEIKGVSLEVILIDDGSESNVSSFCETFTRDNKDIFRYYYQKNLGVSEARNKGIELARGKYICFLDSDDILVANVIQDAIQLPDYDIVIFDMEINENGKKFVWDAFDNTCSSEMSCQNVFYRTIDSSAINGCCGKLIKQDLIKRTNTRFVNGMVTAEDLAFVLSLLRGKPKIYYLKETGYIYSRQQFNADLRFEKHPIQTLNDKHNIRQLSKKIAAEFELSDKDDIINKLNRSEVRGIFCWICVQMRAKQFDDEKKALVKRYLILCEKSMKGAAFHEKILYALISGSKWRLIRFLSSVRDFYLSLNLHVKKGKF